MFSSFNIYIYAAYRLMMDTHDLNKLRFCAATYATPVILITDNVSAITNGYVEVFGQPRGDFQ